MMHMNMGPSICAMPRNHRPCMHVVLARARCARARNSCMGIWARAKDTHSQRAYATTMNKTEPHCYSLVFVHSFMPHIHPVAAHPSSIMFMRARNCTLFAVTIVRACERAPRWTDRPRPTACWPRPTRMIPLSAGLPVWDHYHGNPLLRLLYYSAVAIATVKLYESITAVHVTCK